MILQICFSVVLFPDSLAALSLSLRNLLRYIGASGLSRSYSAWQVLYPLIASCIFISFGFLIPALSACLQIFCRFFAFPRCHRISFQYTLIRRRQSWIVGEKSMLSCLNFRHSFSATRMESVISLSRVFILLASSCDGGNSVPNSLSSLSFTRRLENSSSRVIV